MDDVLIKTSKLSLLVRKKKHSPITGCAVFVGAQNDVFLLFFMLFST